MAGTLEVDTIICPGCHAALDTDDRYCRHCGVPLGASEPAPAVSSPPDVARDAPREIAGWLEHPLAVLAGIFLLLGPLGLPLLWRSRRFSRPWKILLTTIILGAVTSVVVGVWYVFHVALQPLRELGNVGR